MRSKLAHDLERLKQGDHICLIYDSTAEEVAVIVQVIIDGFARRERCVLVADQSTSEAVLEALAGSAGEIVPSIQPDNLRFLTVQDTYERGGQFDPQAMLEFNRREEAEALKDGFSGVRLIGEMTWALGPESSGHRLAEYEALLNPWVTSSHAVVLCLYDQSRFDAPCIHDVLRTHPVAILGDQVCPNPFYEPPEFVLHRDPQSGADLQRKRVAWWIAGLKRARVAEQERERALEKLTRSERQLAEAQQVAHIGSWERDLRTNQVTWSAELYRMFGLEPGNEAITYEQFLNFVSAEDMDQIRTSAEEAIRDRSHFDCDYRITPPQGGVRVINDRGSVILNADGEPERLVGTAQDVTESRQAEQALQAYAKRLEVLSHRLLEVQEEERRHLARELHDEIGQMLTGLRLVLNASTDLTAAAASEKLEAARSIVDESLEMVRQLSFDLRPAVLDQLGLLAGLLAHFERFTRRTEIHVDFKHQQLDRRFGQEAETTAYRIVQEALTNVARHAAVAEVFVRVQADGETLNIHIEDRGRGFDRDAVLAMPQTSGLTGMQERVTLLGGRLTIESQPGTGTHIWGELPLSRAALAP